MGDQQRHLVAAIERVAEQVRIATVQLSVEQVGPSFASLGSPSRSAIVAEIMRYGPDLKA